MTKGVCSDVVNKAARSTLRSVAPAATHGTDERPLARYHRWVQGVNGRKGAAGLALAVACASCSFDSLGNNTSEGMLGESETDSDGEISTTGGAMSTSGGGMSMSGTSMTPGTSTQPATTDDDTTNGDTALPPDGSGSTTRDDPTTSGEPTTQGSTEPTTETTGDRAPAWSHERVLEIDGQGLGLSETVEDAPILISLRNDRIDFSIAQPNGQDLRFIDDAGTVLAYEVEAWNPGMQQAFIWVRVPNVSAEDTTSIRMRYGNPDAPNGEDSQAVWSNGYVAVHHFAGDCISGFSDSTGNGHDAACVGVDNGVVGAGPLGPLLSFDDAGFVDILDDEDFDLEQEASVSAWVEVQEGTLSDNSTHSLVRKGDQFRLDVERGGPGLGPRATHWSNGMARNAQGDEALSLGVHWLASSTIADDAVLLYVDGTFLDDRNINMLDLAINEDVTVGLGLAGRIDEVRISSRARNDDWFLLQGASVRDQAVSYGPEVAL